MHFVNHNFTDIDFETKHMSRIEKTIYLDLRSLYLSEEKPIDGSDMDLLQRRLSVKDEDEKLALAFVLKDKFNKAGKYYKRAAWDKILKDYKWGNKNKGNASGNVARNAVTFDVTDTVTPSNDGCNVTCNDDDTPMTAAERTRKSRQDRKIMIDSLTNIGVTVDKSIKAADLRELYATHADTITSNVTTDVTDTVTPSNDDSNDDSNASNAKNDAITKNHEPLTINHKPVSESAHTNTGEVIVDKFNHGSVDNSFTDSQASQAQPVPVELSQPTQSSATKADMIRDQRADDIENWQAPSFKEMQDLLLMAGKQMNFTGTQYTMHVEDFKAHYAEQALLGKPLATESNRKAKLRKWLMGEIDKQAANQARQEKAKGTFNIDNEDWSNSTASQSRSNSDIPDAFHPSHSTGKTDDHAPLFLNGCKRSPLPGMTNPETLAHVDRYVQPGEASVTAYDRLLKEMKEAV